MAGIDGGTLRDVARRMDSDADPEQAGELRHDVPETVALPDLPGVPGDVEAVLVQWDDASREHRAAAPIGIDRDGVVVVDLAADGPHALIAGTTGSGKSELLRTLVVSLASRCAPEHLQFVLVDYKGGAAFDACIELPHVAGVVTDRDAESACCATTA
jgi:S-DNA-T family DNA segregation ATPase FtsK/SpoIIIE